MKQTNSLIGVIAATLALGYANAEARITNNVETESMFSAVNHIMVAENSTTMRNDASEPAIGGEGDGAIGGNAPNPEPDRSAETVLDDARITGVIKTKLLADPMVSGLKIDVDTRSGVVYLTGDNMNSQSVIDQAMKLAQGTTGVKTVESKMAIGDVKNY